MLITKSAAPKVKLEAIRKKMEELGVDAILVGRDDMFFGEWPQDRDLRLPFISDFTGSAGTVLITKDKAVLYTDGRYEQQAEKQLADENWNYEIGNDNYKLTDFMLKHLEPHAKVGIDPRLHSIQDAKTYAAFLKKQGHTLKFLSENPVDSIWANRPKYNITEIFNISAKLTGRGHKNKIKRVTEQLKENNCKATIITQPDTVSWLLNIRAKDSDIEPLPLSYAIVHEDGTVDLFTNGKSLPTNVKRKLGRQVRHHTFDAFSNELEKLNSANDNKKVSLDEQLVPAFIAEQLSNAEIENQPSPALDLQIRKTKAEQRAIRKAHILDGAALTSVLYKLYHYNNWSDELREGHVFKWLQDARETLSAFFSFSFHFIVASSTNGNTIHYQTPENINETEKIEKNTIVLMDSGAQYFDEKRGIAGTTDITRAVLMGDTATQEMKEDYTHALKSHIALARHTFYEGEGTTHALDKVARKPMQDANKDYGHGTGHGVGFFSLVHEKRAFLNTLKPDDPIYEGMVFSNEPGIYTEEYGIRHENLVTVVPLKDRRGQEIKNDNGQKLLGLETMSFAPFDRRLIDPDLLTEEELDWLNGYHQATYEKLLSRMEGQDMKRWLRDQTAPIEKDDGYQYDAKAKGHYFNSMKLELAA